MTNRHAVILKRTAIQDFPGTYTNHRSIIFDTVKLGASDWPAYVDGSMIEHPEMRVVPETGTYVFVAAARFLSGKGTTQFYIAVNNEYTYPYAAISYQADLSNDAFAKSSRNFLLTTLELSAGDIIELRIGLHEQYDGGACQWASLSAYQIKDDTNSGMLIAVAEDAAIPPEPLTQDVAYWTLDTRRFLMPNGTLWQHINRAGEVSFSETADEQIIDLDGLIVRKKKSTAGGDSRIESDGDFAMSSDDGTLIITEDSVSIPNGQFVSPVIKFIKVPATGMEGNVQLTHSGIYTFPHQLGTHLDGSIGTDMQDLDMEVHGDLTVWGTVAMSPAQTSWNADKFTIHRLPEGTPGEIVTVDQLTRRVTSTSVIPDAGGDWAFSYAHYRAIVPASSLDDLDIITAVDTWQEKVLTFAEVTSTGWLTYIDDNVIPGLDPYFFGYQVSQPFLHGLLSFALNIEPDQMYDPDLDIEVYAIPIYYNEVSQYKASHLNSGIISRITNPTNGGSLANYILPIWMKQYHSQSLKDAGISCWYRFELRARADNSSSKVGVKYNASAPVQQGVDLRLLHYTRT